MWTTEIETLFWINEPENEEFIKSTIMELVKKKHEEEKYYLRFQGLSEEII